MTKSKGTAVSLIAVKIVLTVNITIQTWFRILKKITKTVTTERVREIK